MVWDGVDEPMEFCVQSADQEPILIFRQDVFTNPVEHYNTWDIIKIDTSWANVLAIVLNWLYITRFYDLVLVWALLSM